MTRIPSAMIVICAAVLAVLSGAAVYAQDKYALKSPSGIAFSDFKGYEDWAVVSSARTDEVLKVIVANPTMIEAYKAGVPGNGQPFPDGSKIAKLQWKLKKSTEAPFVVDVPDVFTQAFVIEKDSGRFPESGGWGRAVQLRSCTRQVHGRSQPLGLRTRVPCGREGEGPHLPPVPEALNQTHPIPPVVLPPAARPSYANSSAQAVALREFTGSALRPERPRLSAG
jgi:Cytochrome P460